MYSITTIARKQVLAYYDPRNLLESRFQRNDETKGNCERQLREGTIEILLLIKAHEMSRSREILRMSRNS